MLRITTDNNDNFSREIELFLQKITFDRDRFQQLGEIVASDIREGINQGRDISGNPFKPNTPKWIRRKGNSTPFIGKTRQLFESIKVKEATNKYVDISVRSPGLYWQNPTLHPAFKRVFFSISNRLKNKIERWLTLSK